MSRKSLSIAYIIQIATFPMGGSHVTYNLVIKLNAGSCPKRTNPIQNEIKKEPNLANIQVFGAAAYVKDLKARKLDL